MIDSARADYGIEYKTTCTSSAVWIVQMDRRGNFFTVPFGVPQQMMAETAVMAWLPWEAYYYWGLAGKAEVSSAEHAIVRVEPAIAIAYEWPYSWMWTNGLMAKSQLEALHAKRFNSDHMRSRGVHAFTSLEEGGNPPDLLTSTPDGIRLGVDCTSLTVPGRRDVHNLFFEIKRHILEAQPSRFAHLVGHMVYVWFENSLGLTRPYRRHDTKAIDSLLDELTIYRPPVPPSPLAGLPRSYPDNISITMGSSGARFYSIPFVGSIPNTLFYTSCGFELGLAYSSFVTATSIMAEVQRLVESHDTTGTDVLLITAGAPDRHGDIYPAEEAAAEFIATNELQLIRTPQHIERIWLYSWGTGRATQLYPSRAVLFGPIYRGGTPGHYPLIGGM